MPASIIVQEFTGASGLVYYGNTLLFVDDWSAEIASDTIDITNISIFTETEPLPPQQDYDGNTGDQNLAFPNNLPNTNKPWKKTSDGDVVRKQTQYMAGKLNIDSGLRSANIICSGLCAAYNPDLEENFMPRVGNYVYLQFTNSIDPDITVMNFPKVFIKNVSFNFNIKNYMRWTFEGVSTGDFSIFPGRDPN
jgi:hypothetical protein